ncbi:MAG TPA: AAA family ATPase, partial [Gammaproteobacteria bacterium]|nr:AAA family ATPase [Gammaproteobacteria bacterium]
IGIATRGLAVLDCDVLDADVARHMRVFLQRYLEPDRPLLFRVGKAPKWLCLLRCAEGETPKRRSALYEDARGRQHRLEWLRTGQQFLAHGVHPDTRKPMHWPRGDAVTAHARRDELPAVSNEQIDAIDAEFDRVAALAGWRRVSGAQAASGADDAPTPPVDGLDREIARAALEAYGNDDLHYDEWLEVGMALHHQFDGAVEAFELWDEWSATASKYGGGEYGWKRWESFNAERPGGVSMRSVLQAAELAGWQRPPGVEQAPAAIDDFPDLSQTPDLPEGDPQPPLDESTTDAADNPPFPTVDLSDLADAAISEPSHIIHPLLPRNVVTLLGAHGGSGKTMLALVQAVCVATGRTFMGHDTETAPVVFFSAEDNAETIRWRLQKICWRLEVDPGELAGRLTVYDLTELNPALYGEGARRGVRYGAATVAHRKLAEAARGLGAGLIVIDNASDTFEANENERARVRGFMRSLQRMAIDTGAAVELIAHVDKASAKKPGTPEGYSGSTAWHNSARSRLYLRAEGLDRLVLEHQKANFSRRAVDTHMVWDQGVPVIDGREPEANDGLGTGTDAWSDARRRVLRLIDEFHDRGEYIPVSFHAPGNAWSVLAGEIEFPDMERPAFQALVRDLERGGDLRREIYRTAQRKERERWSVTDQGKRAFAEAVTDDSWLDEPSTLSNRSEEGAPSAPS